MRPGVDVFVAGAGPAGSLTALLLSKRGLRVEIADRATFPRAKVCGSCLGRPALDALAAAGLGGLPDELGAARLSAVEVTAGGRTARLALPSGRALSRRALDDALLAAAACAGAEVHTGAPAVLTGVDADGVRLRRGGEEITARVAVAADGLSGTFLRGRRELAPRVRPGSRIGAGAVIASGAPYPGETVHLAVGGGGYAGLVRVEGGDLAVAACLDLPAVRAAGGPGPLVQRLLAEAGLPAVPELRDSAVRATAPLSRTRPRRAAERLFVVGDAAGYVEPFTGEGIGWALRGALAVVPFVVEAARAWRPEIADAWERRHEAAVRREQVLCRALSALLRRPGATGAAVRMVAALPWLAHPVIARLSRPTPEVAA